MKFSEIFPLSVTVNLEIGRESLRIRAHVKMAGTVTLRSGLRTGFSSLLVAVGRMELEGGVRKAGFGSKIGRVHRAPSRSIQHGMQLEAPIYHHHPGGHMTPHCDAT